MISWRLTGFYGEPDRSKRRNTWELLRILYRDCNLPWCTVGDMNNISTQADKRGDAPCPQWLLDGFNDTLEETRGNWVVRLGALRTSFHLGAR